MRDYETGEFVPPDRVCIACRIRAMAPWSDSYCRRCDEDPSDFEEVKKCQYCFIRNPDFFHTYWCRKKRGIV